MESTENEKKVRCYLKALHPKVAKAILECTTVTEIAAHLGNKEYDECSIYTRILKKENTLWHSFVLKYIGTKRSTGRYTHLYYHDHKVQIDETCTLDGLSHYVRNPHHAGGRHHMLKLLHCIQSVANDPSVELFMIGKASVQYASKKHCQSGMVDRFGKKYKPIGYGTMAGLCVLDGNGNALAEATILTMEAALHSFYRDHPKFHIALSTAQSGCLSQSPETAFFTLYLAIRFVQ